MDWFNYYGLIFVAIILIPNVVYALKAKDGPESKYKNKAAEIFEQIGRYGCMAFMIFNIPYTYFGFWFDCALPVYLAVDAVLCLIYCIFWVIYGDKKGRTRALSLSILPTAVFLFSGTVIANVPLIVFSVIFGVCHILISYKNAE